MRAGEDLSCVRGVTTSERKADDEEDRISELSDDILCHILSFLPTNEAIATCLLSSRWRFLWTMVPSLDFDFSTLTNPRKVEKFLRLRRTQGITRFHLIYCIHLGPIAYVHEWISAAVEGKVEQLNISLSRYYISDGLFFLPASWFTCDTVVTLKLNLKGTVVLRIPFSIHLPSLKTFQLHVDRFISFFYLRNLFYGSPALELFHLTQDTSHRLNELKIWRSSRDTCLLERKGVSNIVCDLFIQSDYDFIRDYFDGYLEKVVKANVYITLYDALHKCFHINSYVFSSLKALRNVEFISLSDFRVEVTEDDGPFIVDDLPQFQNLVQLHLSLKEDVHSLFMELPAKCPKLQLLNLEWFH